VVFRRPQRKTQPPSYEREILGEYRRIKTRELLLEREFPFLSSQYGFPKGLDLLAGLPFWQG
jgi:hypothetical protein